mmetsp:Transcript_31526/g.62494  ORF Transcript_31526/g.62494 Transcript_31526/m.62494 type:complete len:385 (-) Transcript_31526:105-1259(-)|eukprot:CAMPEP_0182464336 /NCGR_PEP_ID=MMETSP1319-20130603/8528_1 /TAXON_ID=172717 /ORGANISM="Bolidomonas pacifica, Strain RCC208" /LENGTH=384 /DNA_ID=CAMNT_0024663975 /DNA_START=49 /DNA_END=1203 /DNA_ORIENTATION=+
MKLLSATLLVASFAPSSGFGQMGSTEPWRDYDYPDYPSQEQCDATPSPTGDKYTWIDQTAGAWICSTPAANADKDTCLSYGCYYHEDWNACMPSCQMDITDSPEADNCMACTFDSAWVGHPQTGDAPEGFAPGPCPSGCVQHPEGYCGLPCSAQSDNPLNFYACYFCIEDETCGGAEGCQYAPPKDPTATGTDSMGSCRPGCGPGNCESCGWDECSCLDACTWNKRGGDGDDFTIPGSCEDSCEAGNCHLCDPDETGDMSRCESASGCIWDSNSGPWDEATMKNLGECRRECSSDECWSCNESLYGAEAKQMCMDNGCQVVDYEAAGFTGEGFECRNTCSHDDTHSCMSESECTSVGGQWSPDSGRCIEVDGVRTCWGECHRHD